MAQAVVILASYWLISAAWLYGGGSAHAVWLGLLPAVWLGSLFVLFRS